MTTTRPLDEMTHEEIAREAARLGRVHNDSDLVSLGLELLDAVENERDSDGIVQRIAAHLEAQ